MKNPISLFVVALLMGTMFTACEKDPVTENPPLDDTTGATENAEEPIPANTVKVSFDGESWTAAYYIPALQNIEGVSVAQILAQKVAGAELDATQTVRIAGIPHIGEEKADIVYSEAMTNPTFDNPNIFACDYFDNDYLANQDGQIFGNWWAKEVKWDVSAFDATSLVMQVKVKAKMFNASAVLIDHVTYEDAPTAKLKVEANVVLENR